MNGKYADLILSARLWIHRDDQMVYESDRQRGRGENSVEKRNVEGEGRARNINVFTGFHLCMMVIRCRASDLYNACTSFELQTV